MCAFMQVVQCATSADRSRCTGQFLDGRGERRERTALGLGEGKVPGGGSYFHNLSKSTNDGKEKWGVGWREVLEGARYQHAQMRRKSG